MRMIALLLLFANICVAGYALVDRLSDAPNPLHEPVRPERIKPLTPQAVAALGPSKASQLNISCAEWGPFSEREKVAVLDELKPLQLGKTLTQTSTEMKEMYWVSVTPKAGRNNVDRLQKELEGYGFTDIGIVRDDDNTVLSLGVFRNEKAAQAQADKLEAKGIKSAKVLPRTQSLAGTLIVIREPQQSTVAALEQSRAKFPDANFAIVSCRDRAPT